jgi:ABC-type phosphate transport system substrate-binding protein
VRDEFNDKILGKSDAQLKSHWSRLVFTGKAQPPKDVGSDAEVIGLVKSNPGMIGYVSSGAASDGVKVIATF